MVNDNLQNSWNKTHSHTYTLTHTHTYTFKHLHINTFRIERMWKKIYQMKPFLIFLEKKVVLWKVFNIFNKMFILFIKIKSDILQFFLREMHFIFIQNKMFNTLTNNNR